MAFTLNDLMAIFPHQLWLELNEQEQEQVWHGVTQHRYSNAVARWNAYLNTLCLKQLLTWFQDEVDSKDWHSQADVSLWEFVNGTVLTLGETRIVCIPDDKSHVAEVCIPQEWVDITTWAADYYVAVQLDLDACWLRVWGYATHRQIRAQARYEATNRIYCLDVEDLMPDLNVMWVAQALCPPQKPDVQALPSLPPSQVEPLLNTLSQSTAYSPRLKVPFAEWAVVLASEEYRHSLYQRRTANGTVTKGALSATVASSNLSLWFRQVFTAGWQALDPFFSLAESDLDFHCRRPALSNDEIKIKGFKLIDLGRPLRETAVVLEMGLTQGLDDKVWVRVRLYATNGGKYLPADIALILLAESGTALQTVRSRTHDNYLQLKRFKPQHGVRFSLKVTLGDASVQENFVFAAVEG